MNKCAWYRLQFYTIALLVAFNFCCTNVAAQDTLSITIQDAEKIFLQNNLSLLAAKYNIDANRALIRQAKLWDNPVIIPIRIFMTAREDFLNMIKLTGRYTCR